MNKNLIIWIVLGVVVIVVATVVIIYNTETFFPEKEAMPGEKERVQPSAEEGPAEESGLTKEQIETIIGQPVSEEVQPIIEAGTVVGVATGSAPLEESTEEPSAEEVIGGAGLNLQEEIDRIRQQK